MDYFQMTAPCGLDCFNCPFFLAHEDEKALDTVKAWSAKLDIPLDVMLCKGCRAHNGRIPLQKHLFGQGHRCAAYECSNGKAADFCCDCDEFPCDNLHPYADKATELPHNTKVFNLCLIRKMGVDHWAASKASQVRHTYFTQPWTLSRPNDSR